jgi:acyl-homoserine lactone acylase PvdQ
MSSPAPSKTRSASKGYLHARDRFFQMDVLRRKAEGRLAELTGNGLDLVNIAAGTGDVFIRPLGLRAAAQRVEVFTQPRR